MLLKDSPTFVAAFLGIMRAGGVSVPMNTRLAPKDLAFAIADSEAAVLLIDDEFLPLLDKAREAGAPSPASWRSMAPHRPAWRISARWSPRRRRI